MSTAKFEPQGIADDGNLADYQAYTEKNESCCLNAISFISGGPGFYSLAACLRATS